MPNNEKMKIFKLSGSDTARFRSIVIDVLSESASLDGDESDGGIGTLAEKQMHAAIKRFICPDTDCHEVKIDTAEPKADGEKIKRRRFVADILTDGRIYEIQTGSISPLREKISWILENTDYTVTVIHPIAESRWVNVLNRENNIEKRYRSPKKGRISDIACEIYSIKNFFDSGRFSLVILMMEAEQYIKDTSKTKRGRPKYKKYELIPVNLLSAAVFSSRDDCKLFIPDSLDGNFTVKEFSKASKIYGRDAYSAVHSLCDLGLIEECGKKGRAATYRKTY